MLLTSKLAEEIPKIEGLSIVMEPVMNIVGINSDVFHIGGISEELRIKKWAISLFPRHLRIVIMPHVQEEHVEGLLQGLRKIVNTLKG